MWNNSNRTPSDTSRRTSDFQKRQGNLLRMKVRQKIKRETRDFVIGMHLPRAAPRGGTHEGNKYFHTRETPSEAGLGNLPHLRRSALTSAATGTLNARQKIHSRDFYQEHFPAKKWLTLPCAHSQWVGLGTQSQGSKRLDLRERVEVDHSKDIPEKASVTQLRSSREKLGQEKHKITFLWEYSNITLVEQGPYLSECQGDRLAVVCSSRGRKAM